MIELEKIWREIKEEPKVKNTEFDPHFLMSIGHVLENTSFHETKVYLWDKTITELHLREQAEALIAILDKMENIDGIRRDRAVGKYLLKELAVIKSMDFALD